MWFFENLGKISENPGKISEASSKKWHPTFVEKHMKTVLVCFFFGGHTKLRSSWSLWEKKICSFRESLGKFGRKSFAPQKLCLLLHLWTTPLLQGCQPIFTKKARLFPRKSQKKLDSSLKAQTHKTCINKHKIDIKTSHKHRYHMIPLFGSSFSPRNYTVVHLFLINNIDHF